MVNNLAKISAKGKIRSQRPESQIILIKSKIITLSKKEKRSTTEKTAQKL